MAHNIFLISRLNNCDAAGNQHMKQFAHIWLLTMLQMHGDMLSCRFNTKQHL